MERWEPRGTISCHFRTNWGPIKLKLFLTAMGYETASSASETESPAECHVRTFCKMRLKFCLQSCQFSFKIPALESNFLTTLSGKVRKIRILFRWKQQKGPRDVQCVSRSSPPRPNRSTKVAKRNQQKGTPRGFLFANSIPPSSNSSQEVITRIGVPLWCFR